MTSLWKHQEEAVRRAVAHDGKFLFAMEMG